MTACISRREHAKHVEKTARSVGQPTVTFALTRSSSSRVIAQNAQLNARNARTMLAVGVKTVISCRRDNAFNARRVARLVKTERLVTHAKMASSSLMESVQHVQRNAVGAQVAFVLGALQSSIKLTTVDV